MHLSQLGWGEPFQSALDRLEDSTLTPARVSGAQRERYRLLTESGVYDAELNGRLRHQAQRGELPVVGDWVAAQLRPKDGSATIVACLPRRGVLTRKRAGRADEPQVMAANLDAVFFVTSLNRDFNPRRIERAFAMIRESGAQPVLVLSKLDLCDAADDYRAQAEAVAGGAPIHALCALDGQGIDALAVHLQPASTVALIGSSGVGKSTLTNALLGTEHVATQPVRAFDQRGRHTTTTRELFMLPRGALLIDTPGMREFGLWDVTADAIADTFEDVIAQAAQCRFQDCRHHHEAGCALLSALRDRTLDVARYESFLRLQSELASGTRKKRGGTSTARRGGPTRRGRKQ